MRCAHLGYALFACSSAALAAPRYPLRASVSFEMAADCVTADETICGLARGIPAAFSQAAARLFSNSGTPAELELSVRVTGIDLISSVGGSQLLLRVRVDLVAAGQALGSIEVVGEGAFLEYARSSIEAAAARAARKAAENFLAAFPEGSPELVQYLSQRNLARPSDYVRPARTVSRFAAGLGSGGFEGGDGDMVAGFGLEARQTFHWFTVAVSVSRTSPNFMAARPGATTAVDANLATWDVGFEPGASFTLLPNLDLRAGPGLHLLVGDASFGSGGLNGPAQSYSDWAVDAWAGLSLAVLPSHFGSRVLLSLIGRVYFGSSVDLPQLSRRVPIIDNSFLLVVGYEWNLGRESR